MHQRYTVHCLECGGCDTCDHACVCQGGPVGARALKEPPQEQDQGYQADSWSGRLRGLPPETPTEQDVLYRHIRLFGSRFRYATMARRMYGSGSG